MPLWCFCLYSSNVCLAAQLKPAVTPSKNTCAMGLAASARNMKYLLGSFIESDTYTEPSNEYKWHDFSF